MKRFGLPTYPIYPRMDLGERDPDEIDWLCEWGYLLSSPIATYRKITSREGKYVLLSGTHERHLRHLGEEEIATAETFEQLRKNKQLKGVRLSTWQWFPHDESDGKKEV